MHRDTKMMQVTVSTEFLGRMIKNSLPKNVSLVAIDRMPFDVGIRLLLHSPDFPEHLAVGTEYPHGMLNVHYDQDGTACIVGVY